VQWESKISSLLDRPREVGMETDVQLGAHICPLFNVTSKNQLGFHEIETTCIVVSDTLAEMGDNV